MSSSALVATVRNPGPSIVSFVLHHLGIGFDHIFLMFDDPSDPWMSKVPDHERVSVIPCDDYIRSCWMEWPDRDAVSAQVMVRQVLNAELAIQLARHEGIEWLVHLDADELLDCDGPINQFFGAQNARVQQITFSNLEVLPEALDTTDMFREFTLFKRHPKSLPGGVFDEQQRKLVATVSQVPPKWFFYYTIGKSAVRVGPGVRPHGVHFFADASGAVEGRRVEMPRVLHYMNAGFENFWRRYQTWGAFSDQWFGGELIKDRIGDFHLHARDIVAQNNREVARKFYEANVVLSDRALITRLIDSGVCVRVTGPSSFLRRTLDTGR